MKKLSLIFGLALGMLTVGCSQDSVGDDTNLPAVDGTVTLGVTLEEPADEARTVLGEFSGAKYLVVWSENDKVLVNGNASQAVDASYVGKSEVQFVVADVVAPYSVLYPADALDTEGYLAVPTVQAYTAGSFANGSAVMAGYSAEENVALKHLFSFVKLTVAKGADTGDALASVTVTSLSGRALSGQFEVDYQTATINPAAGKGVDNTTVSNVPYVDGKAVVYLAVPAGEYVGGFEVAIAGADGKVMTKTAYTATGVDLPAGYLLNMPELAYAGEATADKVITTADQLVNFLCMDLAQGGTFTGVAKLGADIDMTGQVLDGNTAVLLEGATLDGQGHLIKNWTATEGLVYENYGTIKNITLDKSCKLSFNLTSSNRMCGFIAMCNLGTVSGCVNNADITAGDSSLAFGYNRQLGAIVGSISHGALACTTPGDPDLYDQAASYPEARVENCVNNGNITITADSYHKTPGAGWMYIGGVAGLYHQHKYESTGGLYNCVNNGAISVSINAAHQNLICIGGVMGSAGKIYNGNGYNAIKNYCLVENCDNNGAVTYNGGSTGSKFHMGGIVGVAHASLLSCTNSGAVTVTGTEEISSELYMGGITSFFSGNITDCHNNGKVHFDYINSNYTFYVGGIAGKNITYYKDGSTYNTNTISNCTNSKEVEVRYYAMSDRVNGIAGIVGGGNGTCGILNIDNCENSGNVTVEVLDAGTSKTSRPQIGGIGGDIQTKVGDGMVSNCVNRGAVSLTHNITASNAGKDASVCGLVGTNYISFSNCQSLGNITLSGTGAADASNGASKSARISPIGCRLANWDTTIDGCVVDCEITYPEGAVFGLIQADTWVSTKTVTIGATKANVVKSTTKVNDVAVTADFLADTANLLGQDQNGAVGTGNFVFAEGGVVLQ